MGVPGASHSLGGFIGEKSLQTIPFISRYRLSASNPLGFGSRASTGSRTSLPSWSLTVVSSVSMTVVTIESMRLHCLEESDVTDLF